MKIFNWQSKKSLFYTSIVAGLILNILSMFVVVRNSFSGAREYLITSTFRGFPLPVSTYAHGDIVNLNLVKYYKPYVFVPFIINCIFWILLVFVVLSLISRGRAKFKST